MTHNRIASWSFVLAFGLVVAGCGGSVADPSVAGDGAVEIAADEIAADEIAADEIAADETAADDSASDSTGDAAEVGFGELIEGSFIFTGVVEQRYYVSDDELEFQLGGGCSDGAFGFSVLIRSAETDAPVAQLTAQMQQDLSGGGIGEFEVDADVALFSDDNIPEADGPMRMIISEHNTGGANADFNARRMTVTLLGAVPTDAGDIDVDVTFRWVMGCP
jgi:hypothetical protein